MGKLPRRGFVEMIEGHSDVEYWYKLNLGEPRLPDPRTLR